MLEIENAGNNFIEIHKPDLAHFLSAPWLAWQACLKATEVKKKFSTNIDMFLIVEKRIRGGICHAIHRYAKSNNKYMKNSYKNKESWRIQYLDANDLYG